MLLCAANTSNDVIQTRRTRIHAILVGDPGLAKSALLREATKLVLNSRYESGQNSSGKSLTAIVSKEDENYVLRLGPASLTRGTFCAVNELGRIQYEDQAYLLDLMEEGEFTINKHGINPRIKAPFNASRKIKEGLKGSSKGYYPISLEKLREENKALYDIVVNRIAESHSTY